MLAEERQEQIFKLIREQKNIKTSELMEIFNVSNETIRRDLDYLEQQGCLKKVYGGAILTKKLSWEPSYNERALINKEEKKAIGIECAKLINDNDIIFMDLGTTPLEVVKNLRDKLNLTIFTTSLYVAGFVTEQLDAKCIILGGEVRKKEKCLNGPLTELVLEHLHFDKAILLAGGIDDEIGLSDYDLNDVSVKKKVVNCVDEAIVVCDSSKFGVKALSQVVPLKSLSVIVTDNNIDKKWKEEIIKSGVNLIICNLN